MSKELANQNFFLSKIEAFIRQKPLIYIFIRYIIGKYLFKFFHESDLYGLKNFTSNKKGIILDIGSNDGVSSKLFHYYFRNMKIHAYEPLKFFHNEYNKLTNKNITLHNYAVSNNSNVNVIYCPYYLIFGKKFYLSAYSSHSLDDLKLSIRDFKPQNKLLIEKFDIHTRPLKLNIDNELFLIKIDTNGHEYSIIKNLHELLKIHKPLIILEIGKDIKKITLTLNQLDYKKLYYNRKQNNFSEKNKNNSINAFFLNNKHLN